MTRIWRTPAVRHLAWLCNAGSLTDSDLRLDLQRYLPPDLDERLAHLDHHPEPLLARIADNPHPRLGLYFERLYHFLLGDILHWRILLENVQVRREGRTLGEMDFVVHNRHEDRIEHHEIAVKFYLGVPGAGNAPTLWYGPNAQDRLDLKTERLLTHQCRLTERPEAQALLRGHGIDMPTPRLFMPGYLFYPANVDLSSPPSTPSGHGQGRWRRAEMVGQENVETWALLQKPHWLGRYQSATPPDMQRALAEINAVRSGGPPRLFAHLAPHRSGEGWEEIQRTFVVPDHWPGPPKHP